MGQGYNMTEELANALTSFKFNKPLRQIYYRTMGPQRYDIDYDQLLANINDRIEYN